MSISPRLITGFVVLGVITLGWKPVSTALARNAGAVAALHNAPAAPWFDHALAIDPNDARSRTLLARTFLQQGQSNEAQALLTSPDGTDGWSFAATLLWQQGNQDGAITAWQHIQNVANRFFREGEVATAAGDLPRARQAYVLAAAVQPESAYAMRRLGLFLLGPAQDATAAAATFARAEQLGAGKDDAYFYVEYAHALQQSGHIQDAVALLTAHPVDAPLANAILADAARGSGNLTDAARLLERSRDQNPRDPWTLHSLANVYLAQGRTAEARATWQEALRIDPGFAPARDSLGSLP